MLDKKVKPLADEEALGIVKQIFQNFEDKIGEVPNWARVMGHRPEILATFGQLLSTTMGPGTVEQDIKWKCAYIVSKINKCDYCLGVVEGMLKQFGVDEENVKDVISDNKETLKDDEKSAVLYAEAVTKDAVNVPEEIQEELAKHYDANQIVEITASIGLFNYINRFNDALGVLPE